MGNDAGMKYTAAYLLAAMNEKCSGDVDANAIKEIFEASGISFEDEYVNIVISKMAGKSITDVMSSGLGKLEATGGGGGGGGAAAGGGGAAAGGGVAEAKKEEAPPEEEEEDMEFDLFG